jgi:hypothetical protein
MAELLEEAASLLETDKILKAMKKEKIPSPRSRPTARLSPAPFLDHNRLLKGTEPERISQEATAVTGSMTSSEATKEERATEVATDEGK